MIKRIFDVILSCALIFLLIPVFLLIYAVSIFKIGSPIIFKQKRPGLNGKVFNMLKFRTMLCSLDENGNPLSDARRSTKYGNFLRATSLDELPGLWNVLKGDMSLVGPRPLLEEYLSLYTPEQHRRHDVRPGITGWAQVNGRNSITWEEKFELDVWYVENRTFWLDVKILFLTIKKVLVRDGISAEGDATMPKFTGTNKDG